MEPCDSLAQRQAQTCAALGSGPGFIHHIERLAESGQRFLWDTPAPVFYKEAIALFCTAAPKVILEPGSDAFRALSIRL